MKQYEFREDMKDELLKQFDNQIRVKSYRYLTDHIYEPLMEILLDISFTLEDEITF